MPRVAKAYLKSFKKLGSDSQESSKIQENIAGALEPFLRSQIINGVLLKNIKLQTGAPNKINHSLGRTPQGWIIVRQNANSVIWQVNASELINTTLQLEASANVTIDLWVF
jgi:hypothetical protein